MVVVRSSEVRGSAFLLPRLWHRGMTRTVRGIARFSSGDDHSRRNAQVAAATMAQERRQREEVDHFLTAHATGSDRGPAEAV
jgi:hypothetical protein